MAASFLQILSAIFGWVYTTLWSLSFYPQPIHNVRRGSIAGINIDFFVVNVLGFVAYFISTAVFLFSPVIRAQYAERHHGLTPTVQINDLAFAGHAVVLTIIALSQFWLPVWGFEKPKKDDRDLRPSWTILAIFFGSIAGVAIVTLVVALGPRDDVQNGWAWIDVVSD
jgi:cystinosin